MEEDEQSNSRCCLPFAGPTPWLVYTHGNGRSKKFQTFCTITSSPPYTKHYFKSIPQLRGKSVVSSTDDWLLLRDLGNLKIFTLWNPVLSQLIHLPPLDLLEDEVGVLCGLVSPPPEDCEVGDVSVLVFVDGLAFSYQPCRDSIMWIAHRTELCGQSANVTNAIVCNGILYGSVYVTDGIELIAGELQYSHFVTIRANILGSNLDGLLTFNLLQVGIPRPRVVYYRAHSHLLASCGRVYFMDICSRYPIDKRIGAVSIWELDLCLMKWAKVQCLEGRAFFAGNSSTWCWGSIDKNECGGVQPNCVYFEEKGNEEWGVPGGLYSYNLQDESLTSFLPCPNIPSYWHSPTWIMPGYQRSKRSTGNVGLLKPGLLERNGEHPQHDESSQGSNALSFVYDKQEHNDVLDEFLLCELPFDLIGLVAKHMHVFDYMNFRATCTKFRSLTPKAQWRANNSYPLLMFFESEDGRYRLMDPCRSDSRYMVIPEVFQGVHVESSKDGWLLLRTNKGLSLHFFNPFTGVRGEFPPPCWFIHTISCVGFSTCPTSSECVTVGISWFGNGHICYHRFGEETWQEYESEYDDDIEFRSGPASPIYFKGAFYFWDVRGYIGVFQLVDDEGTWDIYDKPQTPKGTFHSSHLVECDGELLSVFIGDMGKWVRVYRFNHMRVTWAPVKSLGNFVLFLGPSSSFSVVANESTMANRIYLTRLYDNSVVYYSVDTGKYNTHMSNESFEDFTNTKEHIRCCWL